MTQHEKDELERLILDLVRDDVRSTGRIVAELRRRQSPIAESVTRQRVWSLIDRGSLTLTEDRQLALAT